MQYTYTKGGNIGTLSYREKDDTATRTYTYEYATDDRPTKATLPDKSIKTYSYDSLRRPNKTVYTPRSGAADAKKLYTTLQYQPSQFTVDGKTRKTTTDLVSAYTNKFGSSGTPVSEYTYTYDAGGNITGIKDKAGRQKTYTYNEYGEITKAVETYPDGKTATYTYTYDNGGNLLAETRDGVRHTYAYDTTWKDKLIKYDGKAITYDKMGRPTNYMGKTMTWDSSGNLTAIDNTGNGTVRYTYHSDGQRRTKTVNGRTTIYHYNNGILLSEQTGDETLRYYYDAAGNVTTLTYKKGTKAEVSYFYARNLLEDITAIYRNSDSKLIGTYEYDLWGRPVSVKEASTGIDTDGILRKNPLRYRGYYYDEETGLYYLNVRYYDPEIRRFISADDMSYLGADETVTGYNLFAYCGNNPVMGYDPTGNWDWGGVLVGLSFVAAGVIIIGSGGSGTPAGVILVAAAMTATGAVTTCAAATDSAMVVDVSGAISAIQGKKVGASVVVDFKNDNATFYTHTGDVICNSIGLSASYSVGLVDNYTKPEDYAGPFTDVNGGPLIGLDHCWNPEVDYGVATKATAITFNAGRTLQCPKTIGLGMGNDLYSKPTQLFSW